LPGWPGWPGRARWIGDEPHALGELRARRHDAELDLLLQPFLPHRVPALVVLADVAIAPVLGQVIRVVRRLVGDVGEEGLAVGTDSSMKPISLSV